MLFIRHCKRCFDIRSKEDPLEEWSGGDDIRWEEHNEVICPYGDPENGMAISILGEAPEACPYRFDHIVDQSSQPGIVKAEEIFDPNSHNKV